MQKILYYTVNYLGLKPIVLGKGTNLRADHWDLISGIFYPKTQIYSTDYLNFETN